jgi:heat shock protein HtpX
MSTLRTVFLLTLLTLLLVFVGRVVGGQTGMIVALAFGLLLNFVNFWFSSKIVLAVYGAKPIEPGTMPALEADVRELADKAGLPMPRLAIIPRDAPNAFATGRGPNDAVVAVTEGILRILDRRQLKAVIGHELGHVKNRDMLTMTLVSGAVSAISMLAYMAQWGAMFGGGRSRDDRSGGGALGMLLVALLGPLLATLIQLAISRSREYGADDAGARLADPAALADALEALHRNIPSYPPLSRTGATAHMMIANPFFGLGGVGQLFSTHPDPRLRIARLREMAAGRR